MMKFLRSEIIRLSAHNSFVLLHILPFLPKTFKSINGCITTSILSQILTLQSFFYSDNTTKRKKLERLSQYSLFGNIECLQAVKLAGNTRDSLLMSFKDAKVL